jgi:hypothetical protein
MVLTNEISAQIEKLAEDNRNMEKLQRDITHAINKHSIDTQLNTPDFVLAEYMMNSIYNLKYLNRVRDGHKDD